jgi:hypothetical protein
VRLDDLIVKRDCIIQSTNIDELIEHIRSLKNNIVIFMRDRWYTTDQRPSIDPPITSLIFNFELADVSIPLKDSVKYSLKLLTKEEYKRQKTIRALQRTNNRHPLYVEVLFSPLSGKMNGFHVIFIAKPTIFFVINAGIQPLSILENENLDFILYDCNELLTNLIRTIGLK